MGLNTLEILSGANFLQIYLQDFKERAETKFYFSAQQMNTEHQQNLLRPKQNDL
jgi:hypothetical protein